MRMALLLSGSREDVELVKIDTEECSLVIKGKPFHERYEGLMQYQTMDRKDIMEFSVNGEKLHLVEVFDINKQQLVEQGDVRPIFFENGIYQIIVVPKKKDELTFYHEYPILRKAISPVKIGNQVILMGNLQFQNEVGLTTFEIRSDEKTILDVTIEVFPTKLDYKRDYQKLLEEVNDEIYNLAFHFIRKTYLGARIKQEGNPSRGEFYRLISRHFQQFLDAVTRIERQPHHLLQKTYHKVRGDQVGKVDAIGRNFLRKRASVFVEVKNGIAIKGTNVMPTEGLNIKKELTYDTTENRYVKWIMERLIHKLIDLLEAIKNQNKRWKEEPDPVLIDIVEQMEKVLTKRVNSLFWKRIGRLDRSVLSLVLQMAPGYRDAFQIYLTVSKRLMLQGKLYQMSVKDVATLYEYWTFLKLGQILGSKYKMIRQDIVQVNREGLFVNLEANRLAKRVYKHPITNEEIILTYQKYEGNLPTIPQKPDTMLSIEKKGKDYTFNYIFDAKYRIDYAQDGSFYNTRYKSPGPMEDDINTMHRYRDSIVVANNGPYERTAFGAYVLFPWSFEDLYQHHHFYKSINEVNIGGLPFLPNATSLVERFIERLIEKSPEEIQAEGILPRGSLSEWNSSIEEKVLVGLVANEREYDNFIKEGFYHIPITQLKKGWQEASYIALYVKNGVSAENGVTVYGKIKEVIPIEDVIKFEIEFWKNCPQVIKPVNYGIASYMMTTLQLLEEAEELPELFMKSTEEVVIWRMLRRVSDQIKLVLDATNIDEASKIQEYKIKGVTIFLDFANQRVIFRGKDNESPFSYRTLEKNPSAVFKMLLVFLEKE